MNTNRNMQEKHKTLGHVLRREGSGVRSNLFINVVTLKKLLKPESFGFSIYIRGNNNNHAYLSSRFADQMR